MNLDSPKIENPFLRDTVEQFDKNLSETHKLHQNHTRNILAQP